MGKIGKNIKKKIEIILPLIYVNETNRLTHVAKQFNDEWRSKLDSSVIIEHELEWLTGNDADNYVIMKRKI